MLLIGISLGSFLGYYVARDFHLTISSENGIDYDNDGVIDEEYVYFGDVVLTVKIDRNRDKKVDLITTYDTSGKIEKTAFDDDFDGYFEGVIKYIEGNVEQITVDTNNDNKVDLVSHFQYGVLHDAEIIAPEKSTVAVRYYYRLGKIVFSERDNDLDGKIDSTFTHDFYEQPH